MKRAAIAGISLGVKLVLALIVLLILAGASKAITGEGSKQAGSSGDETIGLSGGTQCDIFCGGTIGMDSIEAAKRKCYTLTCGTKTYSFTCVDNPITPEPECATACKNTNDIPSDCKLQCADSLPNTDCPTYLSRSGTQTSEGCVPMAAVPPSQGSQSECPQNAEPCSSDACTPKATEVCCRATGSGSTGTGDGGTGVILKQCDPYLKDCKIPEDWTGTSAIKPLLYTQVWAVDTIGAAIKPIQPPVLALTATGTNPSSCVNISKSECTDGISESEVNTCYSKECFLLGELAGTYYFSLAAPMKDGTYSLTISAKPDAVAAENKRTIAISWKCPAITFDKSSKFEPKGGVIAGFESAVADKSKLAVTINTHPYSASELTVEALHPTKVSFTLPLVGVPDPGKDLRSGSNELIVGRYNAGFCIKTETEAVNNVRVSTDYVKNEIRKPFTWTCPAVGCITTPDGKEHVATGLDSGGSADPNTGCTYSTPGEECVSGCFAGKCAVAQLEILSSIKLGGVTPSSTSKIYEFSGDRILTVAVKNSGTIVAKDVYSGMKVLLDGAELTNLGDVNCGNGALDANEHCDVAATAGSGATCTNPANPTQANQICSWNCRCIAASTPPTIDYPTYKYNQKDLDPGATSQYFFGFPGGVPTIDLGKMLNTTTISIVAAGSNAPSITKSQSITVYRCGAGCKLYTTQPMCEACNNPSTFGCMWVPDPHPPADDPNKKMCDYKCISVCGNFGTKAECDACGACVWNPSDSQPCSIAPYTSPG